MLVISARLAPLPPRRSFMSLLPSEKSYTYLVTACLRNASIGRSLQSMRRPDARSAGPPHGVGFSQANRFPQPEEASMAHAKDKGSSKNVKKKAQKSVKEKRAEKKAKKGSVPRSVGE